MKYSQKEMHQVLNSNGFKLKKKFGQNFIIDENVIENIVKSTEINKDTLVIEIGPGAGSLTAKLVQNAGFVLCYEIDISVKSILEDNLKNYKNYEVIFEDFLKRDIKKDLEKYEYKDLQIVANLPYYITTPIILNIINQQIDASKMTFMVQKEVGNRFKAHPKTKEYNSLSVYLNYYFDVKKVMDVSRNVFIPVPNVDSIVVQFEKKVNNEKLENEELFFKLVKDSFAYKRKTIKNNLKNYNLEVIDKVLNKFGYNLSSRAEEIPIEVFIELTKTLNNEQKCA